MNQTTHALDHERLRIRTTWSGDSATLIWQGHCETLIPEAVLNPFFQNLLPTLKWKRLVMDFRLLEYTNSATQAPILQFLKNLHRNQIPTRVIYNADLEWQQLSFRCMTLLFRAMPQIQFESLQASG